MQPSNPAGRRMGWLWAAIWLAYLIQPLTVAWHRPHVWQRATGIGATLAFGGVYLVAFGYVRVKRRMNLTRPPALVAWALILVMTALIAALTAAIGQNALGALVYVAVMAIFALPSRQDWAAVAALVAITAVVPRLVPGWHSNDDLVFSVLVASIAVWGVTGLLERNTQLAAAREEIARLAVLNERSRFARDLHDLLGHSLTVISVKAELAGRLARPAPDRAEVELLDVQRLAREALGDVRAAVAGYREMSLAAELASARTALDAAGIEADVPGSVDAVPTDRGELFAWAVREGVTNVVRHSGAKNCRIRITDTAVEITDDGRGPTGQPGAGSATVEPDTGSGRHGLIGLAERVSAAGGRLTTGAGPDGGYRLHVSAA